MYFEGTLEAPEIDATKKGHKDVSPWTDVRVPHNIE
jgi:hypothetical protein